MMIATVLISVPALAHRPPPTQPSTRDLSSIHRRQIVRSLATGAAAVRLSVRSPSIMVALTQEDYENDPADISAATLPAFNQRDVFLHFHGRGGPDREDADLKARILMQDKAAGLDRFVHRPNPVQRSP